MQAENEEIKCRAALLAQNEDLYVRLTREEVTPYSLYGEPESKWVEFQRTLLELNNPRILAASLRFFRLGEMDYLWKNNLQLLMQLAGKETVCMHTKELGSITRLLWTLSEPQARPEQMKQLLLTIWRAVPHPRVSAYLTALEGCAQSVFVDPTVWTEHVIRNLIIESVENKLKHQINHKCPTKRFCEEMGADVQTFADLL